MAHRMPRVAGESHERRHLPHGLPTEESDISCHGEMVPLRKGNGLSIIPHRQYVCCNQASRSNIQTHDPALDDCGGEEKRRPRIHTSHSWIVQQRLHSQKKSRNTNRTRLLTRLQSEKSIKDATSSFS
jgi:hypothetical protein